METRKPHVEKELRERVAYLERMSEWRQMRHNEEGTARQQQIAVAEHRVLSNNGPAAQMQPSAAMFQAPPTRESLILSANFAQRFNIPAPLFESRSLNQNYINPSLPSVTFPWSNGFAAGNFHMLTATQLANEVPAPKSTGFFVNSFVPFLPNPQQLPQAPIEAINPFLEPEQIEEIPTLPFCKCYVVFVRCTNNIVTVLDKFLSK
jgi:hypothetical protein